jgi:hypothetical protein
MTTTTDFDTLINSLNEIDSANANSSNNFDSELDCESKQEDLAELVSAALAQPLFYPPISQWMFAGDTVAILLQSDLPSPRKTLDAVLESVRQTDVEPTDVLVVVTKKLGKRLGLIADPTELESDEYAPTNYRLPEDDRFNTIRFEIHDANNQQAVSYLALNDAGEPVYVNRSLCDADVIVPVGCRWPQDESQNANCLYPDFSTSESQARFKKHDGATDVLKQEINLASESLGLFFAFEIICRPGGSIEKVICGTRNDVEKAVANEVTALWAVSRVPDAELIVTTIESEPKAQTWDMVAQAIISATRISDRNGPIVVWSAISIKPPTDFTKACQAQFEPSIDQKLSEKLQLLAGILGERRVYLRSKLSQKVIEELGIGFIESTDQLARVCETADSSVLVRDGHRRQIVSNNS